MRNPTAKLTTLSTIGLTALLGLCLAFPAQAATREEKRVAEATEVLNQLLQIPEQSIPPTLLSSAYAVAVIPSVVKAAFGVGARHGKGVLIVRRPDNSWSNPAFVSLTAGSFGFQIGAQATDVILVFKSQRGVDGLANGTLTLGADASIAAGPVGRTTSAATDVQLKAEVYSYSRSRGLFAGVSLEGSGVAMDRKANAAYYGAPDMTPEKIFASGAGTAPPGAQKFVQVLTAQTSRLPQKPPAVADGSRSAGEADAPPAEVRTFGIPGPDEDEPGE